MVGNGFAVLGALVGVSVAASLIVLWIAGVLIGKGTAKNNASRHNLKSENTVLFQNGVLVDHDCSLNGALSNIDDWIGFHRWLGDRFEGLQESLAEDATATQVLVSTVPEKDPATCTITTGNGTARVTLEDPLAGGPADRHQALRLQKAVRENDTALQNAPNAIWKTDARGKVYWQNAACEQILGDQINKVLEGIEIGSTSDTVSCSRVAVSRPNQDQQTWFEVHALSTDQFTVYYATDVTSAVQAETAQREFVQTLTKTFANLTTGLAIFDRNQQLALFNPALVDLTALPAEFLSGRPRLMSFFDNLRDRQVMPEPKSYSDWRAQISEMIKTASDGLYLETWSLPSGVTYRVTGRPHPDGAVAFLFEDITAEISLTRRFRAQNDLRQAVLDKLDHAVAVIAPNNVVIFCNAVWTGMFGVDPDASFAELGVRDLVAICRQKFPHPEFWKTVESQTLCKTLSHPIEETIETTTSGRLNCRLVPVAGGAALICRHTAAKVETPRSDTLAS